MSDDDVLADLEAEFGDVDTSDVVDVTTLDIGELLKRHAAVQGELRARHEFHQPHSPEGRDLHSQHSAYLLELRRRKLL